jgi:hypothetical protein
MAIYLVGFRRKSQVAHIRHPLANVGNDALCLGSLCPALFIRVREIGSLHQRSK